MTEDTRKALQPRDKGASVTIRRLYERVIERIDAGPAPTTRELYRFMTVTTDATVLDVTDAVHSLKSAGRIRESGGRLYIAGTLRGNVWLERVRT